MTKKARMFLGLACIALVVNMLRFVSSVAVPENVCDFALGFGVAMLVGTMVNWSRN